MYPAAFLPQFQVIGGFQTAFHPPLVPPPQPRASEAAPSSWGLACGKGNQANLQDRKFHSRHSFHNDSSSILAGPQKQVFAINKNILKAKPCTWMPCHYEASSKKKNIRDLYPPSASPRNPPWVSPPWREVQATGQQQSQQPQPLGLQLSLQGWPDRQTLRLSRADTSVVKSIFGDASSLLNFQRICHNYSKDILKSFPSPSWLEARRKSTER